MIITEYEDKIILDLSVKKQNSLIKIYLPEYAEVESDEFYKICEGFVCLENCKGRYRISYLLKDHISKQKGGKLHMRGDWILFRKKNDGQADYEKIVDCIDIADESTVLNTELFL